MKKILIIIPSLDGGGAEKVLIDLLNNLDYENYSVDLLVIRKTGVYIDYIPKQVKTIFIFKSYSFANRIFNKGLRVLKLNKLYYNFLVTPLINRKIGNNKYDTIVSFLEGPALLLHTKISYKGKNNITWVHCDLEKNKWTHIACSMNKNFEEKLYNNMDKIIFVSNDAKNAFLREFNVSKAKTNVIYNPIDKTQIQKKSEYNNGNNFKDDVISICTTCRLVPEKRIDRLLRVSKKLFDDGYKFKVNIIGQGPEYKKLIALSNELKISDIVNFLGFHPNPYPIINNADIYVCTSDTEGYSLSVAEAICLGKAIISTNTSGPCELLNNGEFGIITERNDISIYNAIKKLINSPDELIKYQLLSKLRAEQICNIENFIKEVNSVL